MSSLVVTPPPIQRSRESSADQAIVEAMVKQITPGKFITNGEVYAVHGDASNDAQLYKRAVARAMNVPDHKMRSRVWGTDSKGTILTDTDKRGNWLFAVRYDPDREKSTRNRSTSS